MLTQGTGSPPFKLEAGNGRSTFATALWYVLDYPVTIQRYLDYHTERRLNDSVRGGHGLVVEYFGYHCGLGIQDD